MLPQIVVFVTIMLPQLFSIPPPTLIAVLSEIVVSATVMVPRWFLMPAPTVAVLPEIVLLVIIVSPRTLLIPPPRGAALPMIELSVIVSMPPSLRMPPPPETVVFPPVIMTSWMVTVAPLSTWRMRSNPLASIVVVAAPDPLIVMLPVMSRSPVVALSSLPPGSLKM